MDYANTIKKLNLEQKCALLSGAGTFTTRDCPKAGVPSITLSDGPNGVRKQAGTADHLGLNPSVPATCFPTAATVACSWDPALGEQLGQAMGEEAAAQEVASCCTDNIALGSPVELLPLRSVPGLDLQPEWVERLTAAMHAGLPLYRATRAVHSCFVLHKGEIVFACEDLGRHNALDKAVGCAVLAGLPLAECVLYTSGRVPLDMVRKAIRAGVPVLVSKSMPTVQSAELAAEYGLQLVCGRKIPKV